ncbi:hypothetical protein [[Limnothrix rosea] IAM M-220]|uniref:hypothetical protein n=1 Tax=[Limnothrix rosea] IAM M-220 TaxID=454133 RepID=UPI000963F030|nr:hypothetical protein [[Limnothrix rosea] IAM M-220]OKH12728.1 hypothetical protein NIES208_15740 [[Limnothrix rosea] IAM M-220]
MQTYIQVVINDVVTEGVLPRHRYQLIQGLLSEGRLRKEDKTWIERLCYGVNHNLLPLVD